MYNSKNLLVDVDSKIPNLALMKLSQYYKNRGEQVELYRVGRDREPRGNYFTVWISCVFTWNRRIAEKVALQFQYGSIVCMGGSGIQT